MAGKSKNKKNIVLQGRESFMETANFLMTSIVGFFGISMLVIYPMYFHPEDVSKGDYGKYFDMGNAKFAYFRTNTIVFLSVALLAWILWIVAYRLLENAKGRSVKESLTTARKELLMTDYFVVAYGLFSLLSFAFSSYKNMALTGFDGWYMGLLSQLAFVAIYIFMSRYCKIGNLYFVPVALVAIYTAQLVILQRFRFNPLGMYTYSVEGSTNIYWLADEYIEKFVSTLGQTTWYSSYAILAFPLCVYLYMYGEKNWQRIVGLLSILFSFGSLCTANSDGAYVGVILSLMVFFWFALGNTMRFFRFLEVAFMGLATFQFIGLCRNVWPDRMITLVAGEERITNFVIHSPVMCGLMVLVAVLYLLARILFSKQKFHLEKLTVLRKIMVWAAIVVVWLALLLIILTTKGNLPAFLSKLYDVPVFNFTDIWGNHRGFNCRMAVRAIEHASLKDLLVGVGPDSFASAMDKYCYVEVSEYWGKYKLACAHNEFLNMMVTQGLLGLISYLGIFISFLVAAGKRAAKSPVLIAYMAAVIAYMGHNFFCYQQCICTPIVFILMALGVFEMRKIAKEKAEK